MSALSTGYKEIPLPPSGSLPEINESITASLEPAGGSRPFPTEVLPEPLRSMVHHAARQTSSPESLCAAAGIGVASAAIGSAIKVRSGQGRETPANLFILAFAHSGSGKGQSFGTMAAPWLAEGKRIQDVWRTETRPGLVAAVETASADLERARKDRRAAAPEDAGDAAAAIQTAVNNKIEAEHELARIPILNISNATAEALVEALSHSPGECGAVYSAEARDIVANLTGRYSKDGKGSDESIFLQAYSGDPVNHTRKGKEPVCLHSPCLTLCLALQPDIWEKMAADSRLMESGFLARSLAFDSRSRPARPSVHAIPAHISTAWGAAILDLMALRESPSRVVEPTPQARQLLDDLATEAADKREDGGEWDWCRAFAARLAENGWRLALVFHSVLHGGHAGHLPLEEQTARAAVAVARWFFMETLHLLAPIRSQRSANRMDKLAGKLRESPKESLSLWKLENNHGFSENEVRLLAKEFPHRLQVRKFQTGGRPSVIASLVHPDYPS